MNNKTLTQRVISRSKITARQIKKNPRQAVKTGIKLKLYETLITSLVFGLYTTIPFFQQQNKLDYKDKDYNPSFYLLKNESQEEINEHIQIIYKNFNKD